MQWRVVFQDTLMAGTKKEDGATHQSGRMQGEEEEEVTTSTEKLERKPAARAKLFIAKLWKIQRVFICLGWVLFQSINIEHRWECVRWGEAVLIRFHYLNVLQDKTASQIGSYSKPWKSDLNKTKCRRVVVLVLFWLRVSNAALWLFYHHAQCWLA